MRTRDVIQRVTLASILVVVTAATTLYLSNHLNATAAKTEEPREPPSEPAVSDEVPRDDNLSAAVPDNAPHDCPGVESAAAGQADACKGCPNQSLCATGTISNESSVISLIADKLSDIKNIILVLSGKGGVGKSSVASQIAWELEAQGNAVGLLDIDICGPSIPRMTGTSGEIVRPYSDGWLPVVKTENLLVMSVGFLLPDADGPVIWRGPKKNGLIKQFLTDVYWGPLDYLIIDTPPGTSDEHLSIATYLSQTPVQGAILVTTPQEVSLQDVRKEINFCKRTSTTVLGVVENMCSSVFSSLNPEGTRNMCSKMQVPYAGTIDMDRDILLACEEGRRVHPTSTASQQIRDVLNACKLNFRCQEQQ